jgi:hypothetical protein
MTDEQLTELFAHGTAPERDTVFAQRVDARIASERRGLRLVALAVRALAILMLAATLFAIVRVLEPMLQQIAEISPHFMGVPVPLILLVLAVCLAVHALQFVRVKG